MLTGNLASPEPIEVFKELVKSDPFGLSSMLYLVLYFGLLLD